MTAQAWFGLTQLDGDWTSGVDVSPGAAAVLQLTVANVGDRTDTYSLLPVGLASGWTTIRPPTVTLFGGSQETVDVEVRPPLLPSTTSGATALTVRVVSQRDPDDVATAEETLSVSDHHDRRLTVLQPALRGRRRASYEMTLENRGNTQASCRMHLVDPSNRVSGEFDPPAVGVEPGATALVRMKLCASRLQWQRRSRTMPFRVEAVQSGTPPTVAGATFVQAPVVAERLWSRLAGVLALCGALAALWWLVVIPAIDDAADDAVRDAAPATIATPTATTLADPTRPTTATTPDPSSSTPSTSIAPTAAPLGEPFATRLTTEVAAGQSATQSFAAPAGSSLEVTDVVLQNTNQDAGTATLLRGADVLLTWKLDFILGDSALPVRTPIVVAPGEELTFQVTCSGVGEGAAGCTPALLLLGRVIAD